MIAAPAHSDTIRIRYVMRFDVCGPVIMPPTVEKLRAKLAALESELVRRPSRGLWRRISGLRRTIQAHINPQNP